MISLKKLFLNLQKRKIYIKNILFNSFTYSTFCVDSLCRKKKKFFRENKYKLSRVLSLVVRVVFIGIKN